MIDSVDGRLRVTCPMTLDNADALLAAGLAAMRPGENVFDLSQVFEADSSALAVMLGWLRRAGQSSLKFAQVPAGVRSLAELYGVTELLPLA